jgi:RHS repeat-associated protein
MTVPNRHDPGNSYRYGFNGKEKDDEIKGDDNSYDFGARMYDPRVGRWFARDPLAKKFAEWSPYNFVMNNPINMIDPDGREPIYGWHYFDPSFKLKKTQWYAYTDGVYVTSSFNAAAKYCTENLRADAFENVFQRNSYYNWVQKQADSKDINSKWFGAAGLVTAWNAVGGIDMWNGPMITDNTEDFLRGGNKFLFSYNMKNAKDLLNDGKLSRGFTDANGKKQSFEGLTGRDLDLKMVEAEQSKVQEYINNYKGKDIDAIMTNINSLFTGLPSQFLGKAEINDVMKTSFDSGKTFDFKKYEDRVKLT